MDMSVKNYISEFDNGMTAKGQWHNYWQELAEVMLPRRATITDESEAGEDRHSVLYDGSPMRARRGLRNGVDGLLKPKTSQWFSIRASDDEINNNDEAKRWFRIVEKKMWSAIYARTARFIQRSGECDDDLVTFGLGILYIGENKQLNGLNFKSVHPRDVVIFENDDGVIDKIYIRIRYTARQAISAWGKQNLGEKTLQDIDSDRDSSKTCKKYEFIMCVEPRKNRDRSAVSNTNLPFAQYIIDKQSDHLILESGFHEFPFAVPRWETEAGEVYPRSPAMVALPDAKTLQAMGKTFLVAGQKAVDPPMMQLDDAVIGTLRTFPGGNTFIDSDVAKGFGSWPLQPMDFGKNIPLTAEMQNTKRQEVEAAFFKNVFNLPVDGPQMTATEIIERKEEFVREMGPILGHLETDYPGQIAERVFGIMLRAGAFPEPPQVLQDKNVEFQIQSPIQRAKRQIEAMAASQGLQVLAPFIEYDPNIMDNFDGDAIARDLPDTFGLPMEYLRGIDERDGIREQRAQAQQQQAQLEQSQQLSETARNLNSGT